MLVILATFYASIGNLDALRTALFGAAEYVAREPMQEIASSR
jgi:hypothetical protein